MAKPVVFLDTSVLIAALLSSTGGSSYILNTLHSDFIFVTNKYALSEVHNAIAKKFADIPELWTTLFLLFGVSGMRILKNSSKQQANTIRTVISAKDTPILAGAIGKDYLLTLDKEFLKTSVRKYAEQRQLIILTPGEFIQKYRN